MITRDNLTSVLDMLTEKQINDAMNSKTDYVCLWANSYGYAYLDAISDDCIKEGQQFSEDIGGILCDKDDFLRLFSESESINPFLIELI